MAYRDPRVLMERMADLATPAPLAPQDPLDSVE